jgi:hypothetical protein
MLSTSMNPRFRNLDTWITGKTFWSARFVAFTIGVSIDLAELNKPKGSKVQLSS